MASEVTSDLNSELSGPIAYDPLLQQGLIRRKGVLNHENETCSYDRCEEIGTSGKILIKKVALPKKGKSIRRIKKLIFGKSIEITLNLIWCDMCLQCPIKGRRYHCTEKECGINLCTECQRVKSHISCHTLEVLLKDGKRMGKTERCPSQLAKSRNLVLFWLENPV